MQVLQLNIRKALIDTMLSGIKQGGTGWVSGSGTTFVFPIALSKIMNASCTSISNTVVQGGSSGHWLKSVANTKIVCSPNFANGATMTWLAIGI